MNDADLGDNIEERVAQAEDQKAGHKRFENDDAHMAPTRWWFASSAFPMIAGTFGPMASAFSICALCRPWRQIMRPGTMVEDAPFKSDPAWLLIINAIQLAVAVTSNIFLLLNMARRVRFSLAQPITIIGWYISSICLICLLSMAVGPLHIGNDSELVWSQAFYYGLFAAILYFICASLMVVTVWGAYTQHYAKDFQLTNSQRTLMLQTIMYLFYLLIGALVFSTIEDWVYLDGVYWANQTLFTVGYGDFYATKTLSRALLIPYVLIGIITLGLLIGSIRSLILERGRHRLDTRMVEKERRKLVRTMTSKGNDGILEPIREPYTSNPDMAAKPTSEYERRRAEFLLMRRIQKRSTTRRRWVAVTISTTIWLGLWLIGAAIFQQVEYPYQAWTYFDAFYFAFVTLTTLGYGDRTPISPAGRSFYVLWTMMALPTMTIMISNLGDTVVLAIKNATLDLGSITILPTEKGIVEEFKRLLKKMSCGKIFPTAGYDEDDEDDDIMVIPPGFLGAARRRRELDDDDDSSRSRSREREQKQRENGNEDANGASTSSSRQKFFPGEQQRDSVRLRVPEDDRSRPPTRSAPSETFSTRARRSLSAIRNPKADLPSSAGDYHFLLACEIAAVSRDLHRKEPKRYTFSEWAWYLKLIGEDEANPDTHRKARPHIHAVTGGHNNMIVERKVDRSQEHDSPATKEEDHDENEQGSQAHKHKKRSDTDNSSDGVVREYEGNGEGDAAEGDNHGDLDHFVAEGDKWSWVGSRSPLMGSMEESEWILDKLTQKLMHELEKVRHEPR